MRKECTLEWVDDNGNVIPNGITPIKAEPCKSTDQNVADVPSGDLISRADAVKAMRKLLGDDFGKRAEIELNCLTGYVPSAEKKEGEYADEIARRIATIIENEQDMRVILESAEYSKPLQTTLNGDLISRQDALMELNGVCSNWQDDTKVAEIIKALPSAETTGALDDVIAKYVADGYMLPLSADRPSGEWLQIDMDLTGCFFQGYYCSECRHIYKLKCNYCPNCGAKMKGGGE